VYITGPRVINIQGLGRKIKDVDLERIDTVMEAVMKANSMATNVKEKAHFTSLLGSALWVLGSEDLGKGLEFLLEQMDPKYNNFGMNNQTLITLLKSHPGIPNKGLHHKTIDQSNDESLKFRQLPELQRFVIRLIYCQ
jgi:hypothetical protein